MNVKVSDREFTVKFPVTDSAKALLGVRNMSCVGYTDMMVAFCPLTVTETWKTRNLVSNGVVWKSFGLFGQQQLKHSDVAYRICSTLNCEDSFLTSRDLDGRGWKSCVQEKHEQIAAGYYPKAGS